MRSGGAPAVVALLDVSSSAALNEAQRLAVDVLSRDDRALLARFAGSAALGAASDSIDRGATDIGAALAYAANLLRASDNGRIVLLTDGADTYGGAREMIPRLQAEGISVYAVPLEHAEPPPLRIRELRFPASAPIGRVGGRVALESESAGSAELELFVDGELRTRREARLEEGAAALNLSFDADSEGEKRVSVVVRSEGGAEAHAAAFIRIASTLRGLYLHAPGGASEGSSEQRTALRSAMERDRSVQWTFASADAAPSLHRYDVVLFDNVSADRLPFEWMEAFREWVSGGGGWLAVGGPDSFGAGGWSRTALERAAPASMVPSDKRKPLALVLLLDKSGSAARRSKWSLAVRAAREAARALHPADRAAAIAFDTEARVVVPLTEAERVGAAVSRLEAISPGGGTDLANGLEAALELLREADLPRKHTVLFSDGQSASDPLEAVRRMAAEGITVSAAAVGEDARPELAEAARLGGGAFYALKDASDLTEAFVREASQPGELIVQRRVEARASFPSALTDRLSLSLDGFVSASAKPAASVFLETQEGDPLLVGWSYGLGRALAFLSDSGNRWTADWASSPGYAERWSAWLRWVSPAVETGSYDLAAEAVGSRLSARAEFPSEAQTPSDFAVEAEDPVGKRISIPMRREGAGFVGGMRLGPAGAYALSAGPLHGQKTRRRIHYGGGAETSTPPDPGLLPTLAEETGGVVSESLGDWLIPRGKTRRSWTGWWIGGALACLSMEWIVRQIRLPLRRSEAQEASAAAPAFAAPVSSASAVSDEAPLLARLQSARERVAGR